MSEKVGYVALTVKVPRKLLTFLEAMAKKGYIESLQEYLEYSIIQAVGADIDALEPFGIEEPEEAREAIKRYGLNEMLKETPASEFC